MEKRYNLKEMSERLAKEIIQNEFIELVEKSGFDRELKNKMIDKIKEVE